jgi:hypothetical protein
MFLRDDRENVYDQPSIPYQPAYQETAYRANQQQEAATLAAERGARMPKERARALVNIWKRWIVVASLASMGAFAGLIATHLPASATTEQQPTRTTSNNNTQTTSGTYHRHHKHDEETSSSDSSSGSFFQQPQQGGDQFGSSSSDQQPVTRSHAS